MNGDFWSNVLEFFGWIKTGSGKDVFFGFIFGSVILAGSFAILKIISKYLFFQLSMRWGSGRQFSQIYGEYFLYHPPLIISMESKIPRVAILRISRGWLNPANIDQLDTNDRSKKLYDGSLEKIKIGFSCWLKPKIGDCGKSIILWDFQKRRNDKKRISVGVMSSINFQDEPYRVPVIVSEMALNRLTVDALFKILRLETTLTVSIRRKAFDIFDSAAESDGSDEFEHMITPRSTIIQRPLNLRARVMRYLIVRKNR